MRTIVPCASAGKKLGRLGPLFSRECVAQCLWIDAPEGNDFAVNKDDRHLIAELRSQLRLTVNVDHSIGLT